MPALSVLLLTALSARATTSAPNIVIVLADDVGMGDTGHSCISSNSSLCPKTPVLDEMASSPNSIVFQRFYAGAGVCSPTRASVLTGRNNRRSCIVSALSCDHMNPAWTCSMGPGIARTEFTIAHAVRKSKGAHMTQHIGKWHLGDFWNKKQPTKKRGFSNPANMGFEEYHSTEAQTATAVPNCGCFPPKDWTPPNPQPDFPSNNIPPNFPHTLPGENCVVGGGIYVNESYACANYWEPNASDALGRGATNLSTKIVGDDGDYLFDEFQDFVTRAVNANRPFLSAIWTHYIHLPHPPMPSFYESAVSSGDPDYVGALEQWDSFMGRVRTLLKNKGIFNNTLVWVTSDNGPHCSESPSTCFGPIGQGRSNGGLRGCKASIWEGGIRVPGIIEFPAEISEHRNIDIPAVTHDILPTIMDLLDVTSPNPSWPLDGISLRPYFKASTTPERRRKPIGFWWGDSMAWIDNDIKLIAGSGIIGVGQGCMPLPPWTKGLKAPALFNLTASPTESINLIESPQYAMLLKEMTAAFDTWKLSVENSVANESMCNNHNPEWLLA